MRLKVEPRLRLLLDGLTTESGCNPNSGHKSTSQPLRFNCDCIEQGVFGRDLWIEVTVVSEADTD